MSGIVRAHSGDFFARDVRGIMLSGFGQLGAAVGSPS